MTTIAEAAAAALEAERQKAAAAEVDRQAAAEAARQAAAELERQIRDLLIADGRARLLDLSGGTINVEALTVEHVDTSNYFAILSDGTAALAVYDDGRVFLVAQVNGRWAHPGRAVRTLAELGAALAAR